jgi:O-acetyl-ADP-ribose deacetylase (regulator of RNase III)
MGMAFDENEEEEEEEDEDEEDDDEDDKFRKSDGLAGATHAAEGHHLTHHHFLSSIGTPDIDRQRTKSDLDDDLSNIMLASRLVFGTKCNRVCLYTESDPARLIADCIVRSVDSGLLHANRGESYWRAAVARAGTRLLISCETFLAQHNHSGTGLARGELVLTPAFDLPLRYILHAVTCTKEEQDKRMGVAELEATYRLIFERVQKENYQSLVLPFIGDASSSSAIDSATALVSVVMEACGADQDLFGLEKLVVACETSEELTALQSAIKTAASSKMTFQ